MQSLNELIGNHPDFMDSLTGTVVTVVFIVFSVTLLLTVRKMYVENKKGIENAYSDSDIYYKWSIYLVSILIASFLSLNIGSIVYFSNQKEAGQEHYDAVVHAAVEDIKGNFEVEDVELYDHTFRGDYYGVEAIINTPGDTYHVSFIYDKETDSMVPKPTSDTPIEELPIAAGSAMEDIVNEYDTFAGAYLQKVYSLEDNDNSGGPVISSGKFISSIIFSSLGVLAFGFIVLNKRTMNFVVTLLAAIGVIITLIVMMIVGGTSGSSSYLKDARIQNVEHNYDIVSGDYETRDGRALRGRVLFSGAKETQSVRFEYIKPLGHMVDTEDDKDTPLRPESPLNNIIVDNESS